MRYIYIMKLIYADWLINEYGRTGFAASLFAKTVNNTIIVRHSGIYITEK